MLLLSTLATSIDSFIIGLSLKLTKTPLNRKEFLFSYLYTFLLLILFHSIIYLLNISIIFKYTQFFLFFLLALLSLKKEKEEKRNHGSLKELLIILFGNSIDGMLVSMTFLNQYSFLFLSFLFSSTSLILLYMGYKLPIKRKKRKYMNSVIFFLLAIFSLL